MEAPYSRNLRRWLPAACLAFTLAFSTARAAELTSDIVIPLNERLLTHLETTATSLAAKERGDRALKKDFEACIKDKKIGTLDETMSSMTARHPRMAAALAAEGWTVKDFFLSYLTFLSMPFTSELSHGGVPDENKGVRQNVVFYDKHKARVDALIVKMNPLTGLAEKKK